MKEKRKRKKGETWMLTPLHLRAAVVVVEALGSPPFLSLQRCALHHPSLRRRRCWDGHACWPHAFEACMESKKGERENHLQYLLRLVHRTVSFVGGGKLHGCRAVFEAQSHRFLIHLLVIAFVTLPVGIELSPFCFLVLFGGVIYVN